MREEFIEMFDALILREIIKIKQEKMIKLNNLKLHYETVIAGLNKEVEKLRTNNTELLRLWKRQTLHK